MNSNDLVSKQSRRSVLKKVGTVGTLATAGLSSSVSAGGRNGGSQSWEGIRRQITQARKKDGAKGVE